VIMQVRRIKYFGSDYDFFKLDSTVDSIKYDFGEKAKEFESFYIKSKEGEYVEVWGVRSKSPKETDLAFRIR